MPPSIGIGYDVSVELWLYLEKNDSSRITFYNFRSGSIGLNATVNHSSGGGYEEPEMDNSDNAPNGHRARLNSTSQAEDLPVFRPGSLCDRSQCTAECDR